MSSTTPAKRGGPPSTLFKPGNSGRPKGSRNQLSESFLSALHKDFQENGVAAIEGARHESPLGYCRMIASLLPQKHQIEKGGDNATDDELLEVIRAAALHDARRDEQRVPQPNVDATGRA